MSIAQALLLTMGVLMLIAASRSQSLGAFLVAAVLFIIAAKVGEA